MIETKTNPTGTDGLYWHIEKIAKKLRNSKLHPSKLNGIQNSLTQISNFFECTEQEAMLFSLILAMNFKRSSIGIENIANYLGTNALKVVQLIPQLETLVEKRLIRSDQSGMQRRSLLNEIHYFVTREVIDALLNNDRSLIFSARKMSIAEMLEEIKNLIEDRHADKISYNEMLEDTSRLLAVNNNLTFSKKLKKLNLDEDEEILLIYVCSESLSGDGEVDLSIACERIYADVSMRFAMRRGLANGSYALIKKDLVKLQDGMFRSDREILLTDSGAEYLFEEDASMLVGEDKRMNLLINPDDIVAQELHFHKKESSQLEFLENSLDKMNFNSLGKRLEERGMRKGFTCLFYGPPGTGKTESVYQIAKKTGREVLTVDISETKSMWFGESEKKIKDIFTGYRQVSKRCKITPILLFNEADGVLGKRQRERRSSVDQTQNAMQNILLHEMEKF